MPAISLIALPYDSGHFNVRMGRGPEAILATGIVDKLQNKGFKVDVSSLRLAETFRTEGNALIELQRHATKAIREAIDRRARPILLSGNCGPAALGATAALGAKSTGVVWFDAHGDFNTPETSSSGFLDGMGLAILTGLCWQKLASCFDSFEALPMEHIVQVGVRDLDSEEMINLEQSAITRIAPTDLQRLPVALAKLSKRVRKVYVHVDVDVLDVSEGLANSYAGAGGIKLNELYHALKLIGETIPIAAASITSYDPRVDSDGRIARALPGIIEFLARC